MAGFLAPRWENLSGGRLIGLFTAIGGIVVLALVVAWRVRFRTGGQGSTDALSARTSATRDGTPAGPRTASTSESPPGVPLPPLAFLAAIEKAVGQEVVFLRLRTTSNVFKLEPPHRDA